MPALNLPPGVTLEQVLGTHTREPPVHDVTVFDNLASTGDPASIQRLVYWVEPQSVCDDIAAHHGWAILSRVLQGIARAASKHKVHMGSRVASVAGSLGLPRL